MSKQGTLCREWPNNIITFISSITSQHSHSNPVKVFTPSSQPTHSLPIPRSISRSSCIVVRVLPQHGDVQKLLHRVNHKFVALCTVSSSGQFYTHRISHGRTYVGNIITTQPTCVCVCAPPSNFDTSPALAVIYTIIIIIITVTALCFHLRIHHVMYSHSTGCPADAVAATLGGALLLHDVHPGHGLAVWRHRGHQHGRHRFLAPSATSQMARKYSEDVCV